MAAINGGRESIIKRKDKKANFNGCVDFTLVNTFTENVS